MINIPKFYSKECITLRDGNEPNFIASDFRESSSITSVYISFKRLSASNQPRIALPTVNPYNSIQTNLLIGADLIWKSNIYPLQFSTY